MVSEPFGNVYAHSRWPKTNGAKAKGRVRVCVYVYIYMCYYIMRLCMDNKCSNDEKYRSAYVILGDDDLFAAANKGVSAAAATTTIFHRRLRVDRPNVRSFCKRSVCVSAEHIIIICAQPCTYIIYTRDISYYNNILLYTPRRISYE